MKACLRVNPINPAPLLSGEIIFFQCTVVSLLNDSPSILSFFYSFIPSITLSFTSFLRQPNFRDESDISVLNIVQRLHFMPIDLIINYLMIYITITVSL